MTTIDLMANPMTTQGDVIYGGASGAPTRLAAGSEGQALVMGATVPEWGTATAAGTTPMWAVHPLGGLSLEGLQPFAGSNQCLRVPCVVTDNVEITGIYFRVGTSNGTISVALYDDSDVRVATSGSVACPGTGLQTVNFSAAYNAAPGRYWMALSASGTTATFGTTNASGTNVLMTERMDTAHPAPDPYVRVSQDNRAPCLLGIITGGWTP